MSEIAGRTPSWCDGTPHSPQAIPPLPFHDWRWDGDDPYVVCRRCNRIEDARTRHVVQEGRA